MSGERPLPYVDGACVLVSGRVAAKWLQYLDCPTPKMILNYEDDAEELAARAAMRKAAKSYSQVRALTRNYETSGSPIDECSIQEWIGTAKAAELLGLSVRRVQQLAAGGMGHRQGGRWLLSSSLVLAHREDLERWRNDGTVRTVRRGAEGLRHPA